MYWCEVLYKRCSENVIEELNDLKAVKEKQSHGLTTIEAIQNLSKAHIRTPFIIIVGNFILSNFSGVSVMVFYAVGVFKQAGIDGNENLAHSVKNWGIRRGRKNFHLNHQNCYISPIYSLINIFWVESPTKKCTMRTHYALNCPENLKIHPKWL